MIYFWWKPLLAFPKRSSSFFRWTLYTLNLTRQLDAVCRMISSLNLYGSIGWLGNLKFNLAWYRRASFTNWLEASCSRWQSAAAQHHPANPTEAVRTASHSSLDSFEALSSHMLHRFRNFCTISFFESLNGPFIESVRFNGIITDRWMIKRERTLWMRSILALWSGWIALDRLGLIINDAVIESTRSAI